MGLFGKKEPAAPSIELTEKLEPVAVKPRMVNGNHERYDRLKDWLRANEETLAAATLADDARLSHHHLAVYPAAKNGCLAYGAGCFGPTDPKASGAVYLLGDTHGDFDTFLAILDTIHGIAKENDEANPAVYLLGDIVDRNGEGCMLECALILAILQGKLEGEFSELNEIRIGIIKGDHDIGLIYDEPYSPEKRFRAMVNPADYCDWLNRRLDEGGDEGVTKIGRAWIRLMKECPAAAFLEETGTLIAHGGVPREDLQRRVVKGEPYMLQSDAFAQDFEWCRMVDKKMKLLNRGSKTSEIGGLEFDAFCKIVFPGPSRNGAPTTRVRRFVFGHQHPAKGFEQYTKWYDGYEAICIASYRDDGVCGGPTIPHIVRLVAAKDAMEYDELADKNIARHADEKFDVYRVELSFEEDKPAVASEPPTELDAPASGPAPENKPAAPAAEPPTPVPEPAEENKPAMPVVEKQPETEEKKVDESPVEPAAPADGHASDIAVPSEPSSTFDMLVDRAKSLITKYGVEEARQKMEVLGNAVVDRIFKSLGC